MKKSRNIEDTGRMDPILDEHRWKEPPKKKKKGRVSRWFRNFFLWLFFMILGISCIFLYLAFTHRAFQVDQIQIHGNHRNDKATILDQAQIHEGQNIFRIKTKDVKTKIEALPEVNKVKVTKVIPNEILIDIEEQFDIGYSENDGMFYIIDNHGKVSDRRETRGELEYGIEFLGLSDLTVGQEISPTMTQLVEAWKKCDTLSSITSLDSKDPDNMILTCDDIQISLGKGDKAVENFELGMKILKQVKEKRMNISEIILNVGKNPILVNKE